MSPPSDAVLVAFIVAVPATLTALAGLLVSLGNRRVALENARDTNEKIGRVETKVEEVHRSTNGLSERNEAIAKKLGVAEGKAAEKANPSP